MSLEVRRGVLSGWRRRRVAAEAARSTARRLLSPELCLTPCVYVLPRRSRRRAVENGPRDGGVRKRRALNAFARNAVRYEAQRRYESATAKQRRQWRRDTLPAHEARRAMRDS